MTAQLTRKIMNLSLSNQDSADGQTPKKDSKDPYMSFKLNKINFTAATQSKN